MTSQSTLNFNQKPNLGSKSKFFHNIDGPTAESMLMKHGMDGSFLARPSASTAGDYTLSVRRANQVTHVKIQSNGEFFDLYGGDKFATLQELVEHYVNKQGTIKETNGKVIELKYPLINDDNLQQHEQRGLSTPWFHKHISGIMAEDMLKKGKPGSFLVRCSTNQANALVLCVLVEHQVLHIRIYYDPETGYDVGGGQKFKKLTDLVEFYRRTPMVDKSGTVVHLKQPYNATRMTAAQIGNRIQELEHENSNFWEEFEELQRETAQAGANERKEGSKPENKSKNRFKNILPFDHTRVPLKDVGQSAAEAGEFGEYINANYIKPETGYSGCREYIATQGPMPNTISDFWRMVWQENSRIIVMTTKEEERSKVKCAKYWPTEHKVLEYATPDGAIVIRHLDETDLGDYKVNRLEVRRVPGDEIRIVLHYQYLSWPDHNVPQDPRSVIRLLSDVREKARSMEQEQGKTAESSQPGPIVVHCSAGIGRTGSVIIIDMLLNFIDFHGLDCDIDIQKLTHHVRSQRSGMVQTEGQYKFVYKAVHAYVEQLLLQHQQHQQPAVAAAANGHEYTNLPPNKDTQQQQQPIQQPTGSTVTAPVPPPRQSRMVN